MRNLKPIRTRRSVHFIPGPNEKMLAKSLDGDADTIVIDLEDAVAPGDKASARTTIVHWLADVDFGLKEVAVRLNPLDSPWGIADLEATLEYAPHLYMVPKAERVSALHVLETLISKFEIRLPGIPLKIGLMLIGGETPLGVRNLTTLASEPRVVALTWGAEDLATAIGATTNRDADGAYLSVFDSCRNLTVLAARAHNIQPIDTVFVRLNDLDGLQNDCRAAAQLGFTGKLTIHPSQIPVVNEAFTPSADAVAHAQRLIEAFHEAQAQGRNAFQFEGRMVDAPHFTQAQELLDRATQLGAI